MIRAGLAPISSMSANSTASAATPSAARSRLALLGALNDEDRLAGGYAAEHEGELLPARKASCPAYMRASCRNAP